MKKRFLTLMLIIALCASATACTPEDSQTPDTPGDTEPPTQTLTSAEIQDNSTIGDSQFMEYASFDNFKEPAEGDEIIVMTIQNYGTVKIRLFPDLVPKAVENFVTHAKNGYYNGLTFHRVISEFMIQGGDPLGTGTGGESIWGSKFDSGMTDRLYHFTGALAYANSAGVTTSGSQFYIVVNKSLSQAEMSEFTNAGWNYDNEIVEKYKEVGGTPFLDQGLFGGQYSYTVFGQVFEGQNIIETISKVETGANDKPVTPVIIESVKVEPYKK